MNVKSKMVKLTVKHPKKKGQRADISEPNELAVIPDARKGVQKTLIQFNCTTDCIVWWMLFIAEGMIVCDWSTFVNAFKKC